ncbi:MAG: GntR family transcriptional regulator [Rhodospirillales bacterium]
MNKADRTADALPPADRARVPLWSQVKSAVLAMIRDQRLNEHARLPSEHELCSRFGVSRTVVREAMNQLVFERTIYKIQGKGAFVAGKREEQDFVGSTIGFSDELMSKHHAVSRNVLYQKLEAADERTQRLLQLHPGQRVVSISRVLSVDGLPRIIVHISIPEGIAPGLEQTSLQNRSLYDVLQRQYGVIFRSADRWLEAVLPSAEDSRLLEISRDHPVLAIESVAYGDAAKPIECYRAIYRSDQARLHLRIA